mgnify:CR=1 FL=1
MYDSRNDTLNHRGMVSDIIHILIAALIARASTHDESKLHYPEKELFDIYTPKLKELTYGSAEYQESLNALKPALDHHYANNSHHPEYYKNGIEGMDLVDLCEMLCDWKAASMRHADGDIYKSLVINKQRFNISDELYSILKNTVTRFMNE